MFGVTKLVYRLGYIYVQDWILKSGEPNTHSIRCSFGLSTDYQAITSISDSRVLFLADLWVECRESWQKIRWRQLLSSFSDSTVGKWELWPCSQMVHWESGGKYSGHCQQCFYFQLFFFLGCSGSDQNKAAMSQRKQCAFYKRLLINIAAPW